ncbi:hypothetical protein EFK50_09770 [Nocardioides marmoriginsengisoli]|uniref:NifU family protein n=1 Tax=Nocardioides marmoriginsengisoli TaxID=661483 RepID=A0A3N0CGF7_9ACTN|nr:hypothetical protein [Nocardioides marmoriginsengisoli]RNL62093.1 hypothetical protein EFK50_09770 [Nocardioides marmoriginsengisoli]
MSADVALVDDAVRSIADAFAADGYQLKVLAADPAVSLRIDALGDVCADCLVPEPVLVAMVSQALAETPAAGRPIQIQYPGEGVQ